MTPRGDYPSSKQDQYMLRFPEGMRERLKVEARENGRSLNAEIIYRLEESLAEEATRRAIEAEEDRNRPTEEEARKAYDEYLRWVDRQGGRNEEFPPADAVVNAPEGAIPPMSSAQKNILKTLDLSDPEVADAIVAAVKEAVSETMLALSENGVTIHVSESK